MAREETALMAAQAEEQDGPACGGAAPVARAEHGVPPRQVSLRDRLRRRPPAALDGEPPTPCGRRFAVAGQAPATHGPGHRTRRDVEEAAVSITTVPIERLACPGCHEPVLDEPPAGWPHRAGRAPEFSHRDGSVLCPDGRGRFGEPVEVS